MPYPQGKIPVPTGRCGQEKKLSPARNRILAVRPVARRYPDSYVMVHIYMYIYYFGEGIREHRRNYL
jgi:hypothetical protein